MELWNECGHANRFLNWFDACCVTYAEVLTLQNVQRRRCGQVTKNVSSEAGLKKQRCGSSVRQGREGEKAQRGKVEKFSERRSRSSAREFCTKSNTSLREREAQQGLVLLLHMWRVSHFKWRSMFGMLEQ